MYTYQWASKTEFRRSFLESHILQTTATADVRSAHNFHLESRSERSIQRLTDTATIGFRNGVHVHLFLSNYSTGPGNTVRTATRLWFDFVGTSDSEENCPRVTSSHALQALGGSGEGIPLVHPAPALVLCAVDVDESLLSLSQLLSPARYDCRKHLRKRIQVEEPDPSKPTWACVRTDILARFTSLKTPIKTDYHTLPGPTSLVLHRLCGKQIIPTVILNSKCYPEPNSANSNSGPDFSRTSYLSPNEDIPVFAFLSSVFSALLLV